MPQEEETTYYDYLGNPAYVQGGKYRRVLPDGSETRIEELSEFMHEATPISKAEFSRRTGKAPTIKDMRDEFLADAAKGGVTREMLMIVPTEGLADHVEQFSDDLTDGIMAEIEADRKKRGLPPLS
jgi:hypothetical protein